MRVLPFRFVGFVALLAVAVGCSSTSETVDGGALPDRGIPDLDPSSYPTVEGKVWAPHQTMPVAGALVYAVPPNRRPAAIPDGVYCDKCVEIDKATPHAISKADGTFWFRVAGPGRWLIVTQKGAFRRIREVDVPETGLKIDETITTLPHLPDPGLGDNIPKILVVKGVWDDVEDSLMQLGLWYEREGVKYPSFNVVQCTIDLANPLVPKCTGQPPWETLKDAKEIGRYQIVFMPCDSGSWDSIYTSPEGQKVINDWVKAGGRFYATDWEYDAIDIIFPNYITWRTATDEFGAKKSGIGKAEMENAYGASAIIGDDGLRDWLKAQNINEGFAIQGPWTKIEKLRKLPTPGPDQVKNYDLEPKAWILADLAEGRTPMTVSFTYGCGRVLFSAYHTEGDAKDALLPQERALLYIILETAVCIEEPRVE